MTVNTVQPAAGLDVMNMGAVKQPAKAEQSTGSETASFRSTMERAEQDAAAAAKGNKEAGNAEQSQVEEAQPGKELGEGIPEESAKEAAEGETEAVGGMFPAIEWVLPPQADMQQESTEEELLPAELAALLLQQPQQPQQPQQANQQVAQQEVVQQPVEDIMVQATAAAQEAAVEVQAVLPEAIRQELPADNAEAAFNVQEAPEAFDANAELLNIDDTNNTADTVNTAENTSAPKTEAAAQQNGTEPVLRQANEGRILNTAEAPEQDTEGAAEEPDVQAFAPAERQPDAVVDLSGARGAQEAAPEAEAARIMQDNLFDQIQTAVTTGKEEVFIQLKPENLGSLVIHLAMTEEGIKAQVRTGSENVQGLVNAQIAQLEEALRARDIPVVQMEVIYDQAASNNFLNQQRQAWQQSAGNSRGYAFAAVEDAGSIYETAALAIAGTEDALAGEGVVYSA